MHTEAGSLLVEAGLITEDQLQEVLGAVVQFGGTVVQNVIRLGYAGDVQLSAFMAEKLRLPMAEAGQFENLPAFITRLVPEDIILAHRLVPIMLHQGVLHVAMTDPTDRAGLEEISFQTGYQASPVVAAYGLVEKAMARYYKIPPEERTLPVPEAQAGTVPDLPAAQAAPQDLGKTGPASDPFDQGPPTQPPEPHPDSDQARQAKPLDHAEMPHAEVTGRQDDALPRPRLEVVEDGSGELEELFFGLGSEADEVIHLTNVKTEAGNSPGTIADAVRDQTDQTETSMEEKGKGQEMVEGQNRISAQAQPQPPLVSPAGDTAAPAFEPLQDGDEAKNLISQATDRDEVARVLIRFSLSYLPRAALFIVKKDILVGWMGGGEGVSPSLVKGIMIPLESPSVFKTVRETETDYFGSLPRTTVNDIFISALGETRPSRVLLVPIAVRHKPICIFYGDCGKHPGFLQDLSPIHLLVTDVSQAFERIILQRKMGRRIVR